MIGNIIREERLKRKLTYKQLAEMTGIGESTFHFWEHDTRSPQAISLFILEWCMDLPAGYFAQKWREIVKDEL